MNITKAIYLFMKSDAGCGGDYDLTWNNKGVFIEGGPSIVCAQTIGGIINMCVGGLNKSLYGSRQS